MNTFTNALNLVSFQETYISWRATEKENLYFLNPNTNATKINSNFYIKFFERPQKVGEKNEIVIRNL